MDEVWGSLVCQGPPPHRHLSNRGGQRRLKEIQYFFLLLGNKKSSQRLTREVCWRERIFDLIDVGLKLIDLQLQMNMTSKCINQSIHEFNSDLEGRTLAVVGMTSMPFALCSANFLARLAFSSDALSGKLALKTNKQTKASSDSSSWILSIPKCKILLDILRFFYIVFYSNICPCAALCLLNSLKGYMEICESLLFNSWSFSSLKQCVKMTSHSFRNPFLRSYLRAFLRFFSSAFSFWAKVKDSASARLSTAMARKTFRRMTESRPSQDYNHCETFTHKHKHKHKPEHELGEDTVPTDKEDDEVQAD